MTSRCWIFFLFYYRHTQWEIWLLEPSIHTSLYLIHWSHHRERHLKGDFYSLLNTWLIRVCLKKKRTQCQQPHVNMFYMYKKKSPSDVLSLLQLLYNIFPFTDETRFFVDLSCRFFDSRQESIDYHLIRAPVVNTHTSTNTCAAIVSTSCPFVCVLHSTSWHRPHMWSPRAPPAGGDSVVS